MRYAGPALQSATRYYWQARAWDNHGNTSPWSEISWWEIGLLQPSDWGGAKWIGGPPIPPADPKLKPDMPAPELRKNFHLSNKPVKNARFYLSAGGYQEPWLRLPE
jgi:alpha-L-rhamnosidase